MARSVGDSAAGNAVGGDGGGIKESRAAEPPAEGAKEGGEEERRGEAAAAAAAILRQRPREGGEAARAAAVLRAGGSGRRGQDGGPGTDPALPCAETKVYVGNLGTGAGKGELERAFSYYGPLRTVWIARNPPGFAFVEFEDPRDAEDAVRGLDGKVICGSRVRVEVSTGMPRRSRYDRPPARRPFDPNDRCYECGEKGHYAYDCHRYSRRRRKQLKGYYGKRLTSSLHLTKCNKNTE
ncbi:serine/arginine-rich splicing factor 7-like [Meleagris gallopavo]|uniref:serine/arginine-rich splicing factor 7-like n=1 Tax=Meleagris gallopavo TaxID=9103 RepID=UPI0012ABD79F|nr:serine/arginine-rich splicing factor 7-like [Meleagris gallopavo]